MIFTKRKGLAAVGCVALIAAASAACGSAEQLSAGTKVQRAFEKLGEQKSLSLEIGFEGDADKIFAAMKDTEDFKRKDADLLAGLKLSYGMDYDRPLKDVKVKDIKQGKPESGSGSIRLSKKDGKDLLDYRYVDGKYYVRGDLKGLAELSPAGESKRKFNEAMAQADRLPASLSAVRGGLKGNWVMLDAKGFEDFAKKQGADLDKSEGKPKDKLDPKSQQQALEAIKKAFGDSAEFQDAGSRDGQDHVKVTVPSKKFAEILETGLKPLQEKIGQKKIDDLAKAKKAPDEKLSIDVGIKDGTIAGLSVDLSRMDKKIHGELPLTIGLQSGQTRAVKTPSGAKELKPQDLMSAFMQLSALND